MSRMDKRRKERELKLNILAALVNLIASLIALLAAVIGKLTE